ncbi:MAG: endonuclease/exonuclease/phosphatase family protein [Anaerolineae bacterium]|jgi:endonuclease/exonuclease/phosphatase family metal-dependent hydrolase|nr:endonuclease/exonuclease/phosphatase family protein [Anaerolineae bacterium]
MKTNLLRIMFLSILFLFLLQMAGTLVESIYILDLLNTSLDEKALGLLFFFAPAVLFVFRGKFPRWLAPLTLVLLVVARGITPYLNTNGRMLASGMATAAGLWLLVLLLANRTGKNALYDSAGLALAVALSVVLRTVGFSLDYSLTTAGSWLGWALVAILAGAYWFSRDEERSAEPTLGFTSGLGLMLVITLLLFAFSAPSVIARWVDGSYAAIVLAVSLLSLVYVEAALHHPAWLQKLLAKKTILWVGNLLFTLALLGTFLAHRVAFPISPDAPAVIVTPPAFWHQIPLAVTLLLFPILFLDCAVFLQPSAQAKKPSAFTGGVMTGALGLVLAVFMLIFTNVWGYVEPVSPFFRNKFWLPFLLLSVGVMLLAGLRKAETAAAAAPRKASLVVQGVLAVVFLFTLGFAFWTVRMPAAAPADVTSLTVMTYNIQQANDDSGERSYLRQLTMIRQIDPDILALQESDSARISLNNNDYVRYYASQLGYYSYYGPATTTGTYGTAILSRYPLENVRTVFSYSDKDEVGTTVAEIVVDGQRFTLFNVHPDGTDTAMLAFADTLLAQSAGLERVIVWGDFNLRHTEEAYQRIAAVYHNVPDSEGQIDHIFLSHDLQMVDPPVYVPAPQSATDHPLLYATVTWE